MEFRSSRLTRNPLGFAAALISLALALASCHTEDYRNTIAEKSSVAEQRVEEAKVPAPVHRYNPLTVTDSIWNGGKAIRMRHGQPLPSRVEGAKSIALISSTPMSLRAIANALSAQTGIPVRLDKEADEMAGNDDEDGSPGPVIIPSPSAALPPAPSRSRPPPRDRAASTACASPMRARFRVFWTAPPATTA